VAAAETHDPAGLFAFDIAVDAGHPRVDLVGQQALARRNDLVGPGGNARIGGLDLRRAAVARKADQPGYPAAETVLPGIRRPIVLELKILPDAVADLKRLGWLNEACHSSNSAIAGAVVELTERVLALRLRPF
jgi:hypothetical protein